MIMWVESKPNHSELVITLNRCKTGYLAKDANTFVAGVPERILTFGKLFFPKNLK